MYDIEGTVKIVFAKQTFDSGFTKREFVVTTDEKFPQDVKIECIKDKCDLLENVSAGDRVKATFNIRGNEYKERYYVNLQAWKLEKVGAGETSAAPGNAEPFAAPSAQVEAVDDDDLPF